MRWPLSPLSVVGGFVLTGNSAVTRTVVWCLPTAPSDLFPAIAIVEQFREDHNSLSPRVSARWPIPSGKIHLPGTSNCCFAERFFEGDGVIALLFRKRRYESRRMSNDHDL